VHPVADLSAEASDSSKACSQVRSGRPVGEDDDDDLKMIKLQILVLLI
jgi:hypothetical protein